MSRVDEIKARFADATNGPWTYKSVDEGFVLKYMEVVDDDVIIAQVEAPFSNNAEDGVFIAHAREDVPWLVAKVEKLWEMLDEQARRDGDCIECGCWMSQDHAPRCEIGEVLHD